MQILNLRELYPDVYKTDVYLNVSDEVYAVFPTYKRAEAAYQRQVYRYKAQYSLDCDNGIENAVLQRLPTPEEVLEKKQLYAQIYAAMIDLPGKQAERIFACFFLDLPDCFNILLLPELPFFRSNICPVIPWSGI